MSRSDDGDDALLNPADIQQRIAECSRFIETVVRKDWEASASDVKRVEADVESYRDLRTRLEGLLLQNRSSSTEDVTKPSESQVEAPIVHLGYDRLYCRARVTDASFAYVHAGMGFHVELTIPEAIELVDRRLAFLSDVLKYRRDKERQVLLHLRQSEAILDELTSELHRESHQ